MASETPYFSSDNKRLNSRCLFFVEGQDDAFFLSTLLEDIGALPSQNGIVHVKGKGNFASELLLFFSKAPSYSQGLNQKIVVICDADNDPKKIETEIGDAFELAGEPRLTAGALASNFKKVTLGLFIFPDSLNAGDLESLCLATVPNHPLSIASLELIKEAKRHASTVGAQLSGSVTKRQAQAYLSGWPSDLFRGAGRGFRDGAFVKNHAALDPIKNFLALVAIT